MRDKLILVKEIATQLSQVSDKNYEECLESVWMRYMGDSHLTLEEVGFLFDITRERIRQIESSALKKLKHPGINKAFRDYLNISVMDETIKDYR